MPATQRTNFVQEPVRVTIHDLRDKEKTVHLDTNALEVLKYDGSIQEEFEEGSEAQQTYYEEISDLLKKHLGVSRVFIYHYNFRSRSSPRTDEQLDDKHRNPAFFPHVDTSATGAPRVVERWIGKEEGEKVMQNRFQIINVWRPLGSNPITQKPLTICDYRSVDVEKDIHPLDVRGAGYHGASYIMSRNSQDAHIWYYLSQMRSNEMFVFKIFDSKPDTAQFAFHTAFINENEPVPNVEQTSLEIRCLIFYDK
ncbi:unnamed protein product [Didymodactylos carnosus]|uniref:Uncharacterized protein n=1 Tax=Didymodactylos carnosus TaxID=1234261 RepID=A0A8S2EGX9_9BILA|nr:unnamed protein product [Didymodactylos carnosus]CAF3947930.1 unnamed protein product [Didymodactylos carnosus]